LAYPAIVTYEGKDRYYGSSSPYDSLTVENLQLLTIEQTIEDHLYFAKTAYLPFDNTNSSNADKAPWVISGGSYGGMLSAFTASVAPGTFWVGFVAPKLQHAKP
jgi:hypothetical protein